MNRKIFYSLIRDKINLTTQNVMGFETVLDYLESRQIEPAYAAYMLATFYWETASQMHPVREAFWKDEAWRKAHLSRYYPYYGRGLIQTTWKRGYQAAARVQGLKEDAFVDNPDLLLEWRYALPAGVEGMIQGIYTGRGLGDYIDKIDAMPASDELQKFINARRVVNGQDRATRIAQMATTILKGLRLSNYQGSSVKIDPDAVHLEPGSKGIPVALLQDALSKRGYKVKVDGDYGPSTAAAVEAFQRAKFRPEYGQVGPRTWAALMKEDVT